MAIQKQIFDYFTHGGINLDDSDLNIPDGFYNTLDNVEVSDNGTLKKVPGYQKFGNAISTISIKHLDRYLTESERYLIASVDNKLYYSLDEPGVVSTISLNQTITEIFASTIQQSGNLATLTFPTTPVYMQGDNIVTTISGTSYNWEVESVGTTIATVYGVSNYGVVGTINSFSYGSRITSTLPVTVASIFSVGDVLSISNFDRKFVITSIAGTNIVIDDTISITDGDVIGLSESWVQFTTTISAIQNNTPFDVEATQSDIASSMLRKSMILTDGSNEPLKFDGDTVHRLGFVEVPDIIDAISTVSTVIAGSTGVHQYKLTYSMYDVNDELVESGESSQVGYDVPNGTLAVAVPVIVPAYGVNNNLMYNIDRCLVTLWKTQEDGTLFYKTVEAPMNTLGSFNISTITSISATKMDIKLSGTPTISNLVVGDWVRVWGNQTATNNGYFVIATVNNTTKILTLTTTVAPTTDATGTITRGYCTVCLLDKNDDTAIESNATLYTNDNQEPNNDAPPLAKYVTVWDGRVWFANGKSYQGLNLDLGESYLGLRSGDKFEIGYGSTGTIAATYSDKFIFTSSISTIAANYAPVVIGTAGYTDVIDTVYGIGDAVNAITNGLTYSYYQNVESASGIIFRERQRNSDTLKIRFDLQDTTQLRYIKIGSTYLTASDNNTWKNFSQENKVSRLWYTKVGEPGAFVGAFSNSATGSVFWEDIFPDNGQEITGIMPLGSYLIVFKEDSCYRVSSNNSDVYNIDSIDKEIGCIAPKSIVSIGNKIYFLSRFGVYETDGFFTRYLGKRVRRFWQNLEPSILSGACACNNMKKNQYWLSVPYKIDGSVPTANNKLISYDYQNDSWHTFTDYNATFFTKIEIDLYFSTSDGKVYSVRRLEDETDNRFDADPIDATIITKWFDLGNKSARKMFQYLITQLYKSTASGSLIISVGYDGNENWEELVTINSKDSAWGEFEWGSDPWGNEILDVIRQPLRTQKAQLVRFKFENNVKDEGLEIQGFSIEAKLLNTQLIEQVK